MSRYSHLLTHLDHLGVPSESKLVNNFRLGSDLTSRMPADQIKHGLRCSAKGFIRTQDFVRQLLQPSA